ncbi:class I SAM-dependent rRNA methyltransferase [bacterium]|nr:class I SAM-dependent rRNA methyltransferase [bacterium]
MKETTTVVKLKRGGEKRLRAGHLWVFSNEIDSMSGAVTAGDSVSVIDYAGRTLGTGYINPNSLIAVRLLARRRLELTKSFLGRRIRHAIDYRKRLWPGETVGRLVYGESDMIPGLIVDRYGDTLAVQSLTAGIECRLDSIVELLEQLLEPKTIVLRNDSRMRVFEGLPIEKRVVLGNADDPVEVEQDGIKFFVDVLEGQKTGFFLDQRENKLYTRKLAAGRDVLDCCCYTGAWSVSCASAGAASVSAIDSSKPALALAEKNAELNGFKGAIRFVVGDMFKRLAALGSGTKRFGLVIVDPPAFAKNRKRIREALKAYRAINRLAMNVTAPGGYLVTSTCSHLVEQEAFMNALVGAAREADRHARIIEVRGQSGDHPVILGHPETRYLTCAVLEIL